MKKNIYKVILAGMLVMQMSILAFANAWCQDAVGDWYLDNGVWEKDEVGYMYRYANGTYLTNTWGIIYDEESKYYKYYYFDETGHMMANTTTPDGEIVNEHGEQIRKGRPRIAGAHEDEKTLRINTNFIKYKIADLNAIGYNEAGISSCVLELLNNKRLDINNKYEFSTTSYEFSKKRPGMLNRVKVNYKEIPLYANYYYDSRFEDPTGKINDYPYWIVYNGNNPKEIISTLPDSNNAKVCAEELCTHGFKLIDGSDGTYTLRYNNLVLSITSGSEHVDLCFMPKKKYEDGLWLEY